MNEADKFHSLLKPSSVQVEVLNMSTSGEVDVLIDLKDESDTAQLPDKLGKGKKRTRKLQSDVWLFFEMLPIGSDGIQRCKCKKCKASYACGSKNGTKNLHRHLKVCPRIAATDVGQLLISRENGALLKKKSLDHVRFRELLTTAVIMHDLPFQFIDWIGIRNLLQYLHEDLRLVTRNTLKNDCLRLYNSEKGRVKAMLQDAPGRISFTSDCWTSITTDGYICLTAHFIDHDWILQKKTLNFCYMASPHTGIALAEKIYGFFTSWGVNKKVFSLTLDNASANDSSISFLRSEMSKRDKLVCGGNYFHVRCCAHVLNLIVQDGLKFIDSSVLKIRECVKYVKGSQSRKERFLECISLTTTSVNTKKGLRQDVPTRWNSTYLMLDSAIYFREALTRLSLTDDGFKHCPTQDEWMKVKEIRDFLLHFYNLTMEFSASKNPTSNLFFPGVCAVYVAIKEAMNNDSSHLKEMASKMFIKFNKYWSDFSTIMAIAVILDPRYKFVFVDYCLKKVHGGNWREKSIHLKNELYKVYAEYINKTSQYSASTTSSSLTTSSTTMDDDNNDNFRTALIKEFNLLGDEEDLPMKSQLDRYLEEPRLSLSEEMHCKFDVLNYWRTHAIQYPEVAVMARDVLSVPMSSVASESAFSMGGKVLDQYRSSLKPDVVEALLCSKNWLFNDKGLSKEVVLLETITANLSLVDKDKKLDESEAC